MMSNRNGNAAVNQDRIHSDILLVLRAAGERTVDCARELLNEVVPGCDVVLIQEAPFEQALRKMCDNALDCGLEWTLVVDADLLISPKRIRQFIDFAQRAPKSVFQVQGYILDKLTGTVREAGPRLYRTRLLSKARLHIPANGEFIRPESTAMIKNMEQLGYLSTVAPFVVAIHDYEQYYRDVYRKVYVHARKHPQWVGRVVPYWRENGTKDADFRIALHGMWHGLNTYGAVRIDIRTLPTDIDDVLHQEGLKEKNRLQADAITGDDVEHTLANNPEVILWEQRTAQEEENKWQRLGRKYNEIGWWRMAPWALGYSLQQAGLGIKRIASKPTGNGSHCKK